MLRQIAAAVQLATIVGFWLVAWIPLALYCLAASGVASLGGSKGLARS